ncbi:hypothetical protein MNV49_000687 [Pseudohyphozyma bogoriensis]|nr:hypothetical protein MNV49_000687 [Pseudohyphozyma bogoriensis]
MSSPWVPAPPDVGRPTPGSRPDSATAHSASSLRHSSSWGKLCSFPPPSVVTSLWGVKHPKEPSPPSSDPSHSPAAPALAIALPVSPPMSERAPSPSPLEMAQAWVRTVAPTLGPDEEASVEIAGLFEATRRWDSGVVEEAIPELRDVRRWSGVGDRLWITRGESREHGMMTGKLAGAINRALDQMQMEDHVKYFATSDVPVRGGTKNSDGSWGPDLRHAGSDSPQTFVIEVCYAQTLDEGRDKGQTFYLPTRVIKRVLLVDLQPKPQHARRAVQITFEQWHAPPPGYAPAIDQRNDFAPLVWTEGGPAIARDLCLPLPAFFVSDRERPALDTLPLPLRNRTFWANTLVRIPAARLNQICENVAREDATNCCKSLDHQAISLKANDKRTLTAKALVNEIETIKREQRPRGLDLRSPPTYQLAYEISDQDVLSDTFKLLFSYLDRTFGISNADKDELDAFLRQFLPLVFAIPITDFALELAAGNAGQDDESVEATSEAGTSVVDEVIDQYAASLTSKRGGKKTGGDLRKKALKNAVTNAVPAALIYQRALGLAEKLFDGDIDQTTFEDSVRGMFGTEARSQELFDLLMQDRAHPDRSTPQQQTAYRIQAESAIGSDKNLYRFEWLPGRQLMSIQLLGKDAIAQDDVDAVEREWGTYLENYVLSEKTLGARRTSEPHRPTEPTRSPTNLTVKSNLQRKICLRSYRLFFVAGSEDYVYRKRHVSEALITEVKEKRKSKFAAWVEKRLEGAKAKEDEIEGGKIEAEAARKVPHTLMPQRSTVHVL